MVYCSKCGKKNDDDAEFCSKCGTIIDNENIEKKFDKQIRKTVRIIEEKAEKFGKNMEKTGERFERRVNNTFDNFLNWYDTKFHIIGPIIWSFLGLIVLRIIIFLLDFSRDVYSLLGDLSDFLYSYALIFFGLMILNTYNSYFNRKYKKKYSWIYPAVSTISFIVSIWIVSKILIIIDDSLNIPVLTTIANFIDNFIIFIFILALIISYIFNKLLIPYTKEINQK
jgi:hypothetical protein